MLKLNMALLYGTLFSSETGLRLITTGHDEFFSIYCIFFHVFFVFKLPIFFLPFLSTFPSMILCWRQFLDPGVLLFLILHIQGVPQSNGETYRMCSTTENKGKSSYKYSTFLRLVLKIAYVSFKERINIGLEKLH